MNDFHLNYLEQGTGEALILLHGNGENHACFEKQISHFAKQYRVIALDVRGHGASPRGDAPFTLRQFAEDLRAFLDERGVDRAHILGFSAGGNIAMYFALKYPQRVMRLILNGVNLDPRGVRWQNQLPIVLHYYAMRLLLPWRKELRRKVELYGLMVHEPRLAPQDLQRLKMPVLVLAGTKDMIRDSHTRLIARSLPEGELCILPGGRFVARENHAAFNARVDAFLEGRRK